MLRQRLFNIGLLQLFILGIRMASTAYLAKQIIQSRLNWNINFHEGENMLPVLGDNEELVCLWKLLDHTILLSCILCLLYGTRDDNETPKGHKSLLLRFWMLIAVMYSWGFCIATALGVDWANWSLDTSLDIDLGQFTFVLFNSAILFFVGRYMKQLEMRNVATGQLWDIVVAKKVTTKRPPKLPKANPPQRPRKSGGMNDLNEISV